MIPKVLEKSRAAHQEIVLAQVRNVTTCQVSGKLCQIVKTSRSFLTSDKIAEICSYASKRCLKHSPECSVAGELCTKAVEALTKGDEDKYLELCEKASVTCVATQQKKTPEVIYS